MRSHCIPVFKMQKFSISFNNVTHRNSFTVKMTDYILGRNIFKPVGGALPQAADWQHDPDLAEELPSVSLGGQAMTYRCF